MSDRSHFPVIPFSRKGAGCFCYRGPSFALHLFKQSDEFIQVIVQMCEQFLREGSCHCTIRRCAYIAELFENMQRVANPVGWEIEQFGKFHNTYWFMISYSSCHPYMAAEKFNLVFHFFQHNAPLAILTVSGFFNVLRMLIKPCFCLFIFFPEVQG